jgi:hypothetical protein
MKFNFTDYFTHPQNIETLNVFIETLLKQNKSSISLLEALKKYYNELKQTHFFYIPFFDDFLDYVINHNKLLGDAAEKLRLTNIK